MLTATSKQKKEEEILNIFSEIRETTTKDSIEYKKLVQKNLYTYLGLDSYLFQRRRCQDSWC